MSYPNNLAYSERTVQVFYANNGSMQVWNKPLNARFVHFYVIGGGGGGGTGQGGGAGSSRNGGGGGAGSSITIGLFQANVLPDILYLQVGSGGAGGASGATITPAYNGTSGSVSYVKIDPATGITAQNVVLASGNAGAAGGNGGAGGAVGGGIPVAWSATNSIFNDLGLVTTIVGDNGSNGTTGTSNKTLSRICSGGAAGGGTVTSTPSSGGTLDATGFISDILGGPNTGGDGSGGIATNLPSMYGNVYQPMYFLSGAGGGAINSGTGGRGGNGSYGSGGGGGGVGTAGGAGGRGGDGLIIITTF